MPSVTITKDNLQDVLKNNKMVVLDFWAPWCGPCKQFGPIFEATSEKFPEIIFGKVNTEDDQELAINFGIRSIPTLMIFKDSKEVYSKPGLMPSQTLEDLVNKTKD